MLSDKHGFKAIADNFISKQFLRFLLVGGIAALANFFSRFLFQTYFPYTPSVALAFTLGTIISFILNKTFTFASYDEKTSIQLIKFLLAGIVCVALASIIAYLGMAFYHIARISFVTEKKMESIVHIIAIGLTTIYNFLAMKFFSFRRL